MAAGADYGIRPAGMLALDVVAPRGGLILLEVDYTSARHAMNPEQNYSPVRDRPRAARRASTRRDFVGRRALAAEQARGGPARRLVGLELDWYGIEGLYRRPGPAAGDLADRRSLAGAGLRAARRGQVGKATSHGWSPILKQAIALASVPAAYERGRLEARRSSGRSRAAAAASPRRSCRAAVPRPAAQARLMLGSW